MMQQRSPTPPRRRWQAAALCLAVAALFLAGLAPRRAAEVAGTLLAQPAIAADPVAEHAAPAPDAETGPDTGSGHAAIDATSATTAREHGRESIFGDDPLESLALSLKRRQREMDEREARLNAEAQRLEALRGEVQQNLARSQQVLKQMEQLAGNAAAQRDKELVRWIKIYEGMPPTQAGQMLGQLDLDFARELLAKMDPKKASKILSAFPPDKAVELGKLLQEKTSS